MDSNIILVIQGPIYSKGVSYKTRTNDLQIDFDSWDNITQNIMNFKNIAREIVLSTYTNHLNNEKIN